MPLKKKEKKEKCNGISLVFACDILLCENIAMTFCDDDRYYYR